MGTSLAPRRSGFDSRRLHCTPLWCQGQHAPFVRLKRRFDSCRRLLHTLVAQRMSAALRGRRTLVRIQPGVSRGRSSCGRAPERHSGETRSSRVVRFTQARGVTGARRAPTSSVRVRFLVGLLSRAGVVGLSSVKRRGSTPRADCAPRPRRTTLLLRAEAVRLSPTTRQVAGSSPARGFTCPGSSDGRAVNCRLHAMTAAARIPFAGRRGAVLGRAPG
jgi:hypothetical protein